MSARGVNHQRQEYQPNSPASVKKWVDSFKMKVSNESPNKPFSRRGIWPTYIALEVVQ